MTASTVVGIHHVGLAVADLDRSVDFYRSAARLEPGERSQISDAAWQSLMRSPGPVAGALLHGPNATLHLAEFGADAVADPIPVEGPGVTHFCLQAPADAELYRTFVATGATEVSRDGPIDLGGYGVLYGYARDPDGIMFEVEQLDAPQFDTSVWVAHVALVSADIDRLVDFYTQVVGVEPYRRVNKVMGPRIDEVTGLDDARVRAAWFNVGNMVLELWQYVTPPTPSPTGPRPIEAAGVHRFVFQVGDLDAELGRLDADVVIGATERSDGGREAYARDPDGNLFGLLELPAGSDIGLDRRERITWM